ncbi:hypothetical protein [Herbidospora cretacea]|uniref:hypothetical protein n=1 Tax=Herbidospora cretacea TaxID=28444 RepID=UPI0004C3C2FB|nr:hypothetical protein [Herbidospora cretacea]
MTSAISDQWELLRGAGLGRGFAGTWVESADTEIVAALLGADPRSREVCDLTTAMAHYRPMAFAERAWIGPHSDGWTHALTISGPPPKTAALAGAGLRFLQISTVDGTVEDLLYGDGVTTGRVSRRWYGELVAEPGSMLEPYVREIGRPSIMPEVVRGPGGDEPEFHGRVCLDGFLVVAGRVSGRFVDREWLGATRALYVLGTQSARQTLA